MALAPYSRMFSWLAAIAGLCLVVSVAPASADARAHAGTPTAVLLATGGASAGGAAFDSVVQAGLEELGVVRITARPGIDLGALQLALDCVAENTQCLRAVTTQSGVQVLIAPTVQRTPTELLVTILRFDARGDSEMRRVVRRVPGKTLGSEALDAVPDMLRELFGMPPKPKVPPPVAAAPAQPAPPPAVEASAPPPLPEAPMEPAEPNPVPVAPLVIGGVGVLALGGGVAAALMMQSTESSLKQPKTHPEADAVADKSSTGRTQALVANVLFGVGGAAVAVGAIWLMVEMSQSPRTEYEPLTRLTPTFGPHGMGLLFTHRGTGL